MTPQQPILGEAKLMGCEGMQAYCLVTVLPLEYANDSKPISASLWTNLITTTTAHLVAARGVMVWVIVNILHTPFLI